MTKDNYSNHSFLDVVKEMDKYAFQLWVDKSMWSISKNNYSLCVKIYDDRATVFPYGFGSCQPLIAVTSEQLIECINCWWRNR
jgi:hypothetical protein